MPIDNTDLKVMLEECTARARPLYSTRCQMERDNKSWFRRKMWAAKFYKHPRHWSWPHIAIYDYSGNGDGRFVWSWVLHLGPLWIIRQRYAL